jgi:signal transduction histidine kinase
MSTAHKQFWRYVRGLAAPALLWALFALVLAEPLQSWLQGDRQYDEAALREWIEEARIFRETLPEMARDYLGDLDRLSGPDKDPAHSPELVLKAAKIQEHMRALGNPPTKMYLGQLPLFPVIYRLELTFERGPTVAALPIVWESNLTRQPGQYRELLHRIDPRVLVKVEYQLHAFNKRQQIEQAGSQRVRWVGALAVCGTVAAGLWIYLVRRREHEREQQRALARHQLDQAEHRRLEEELRRRQAEQRQEEVERKLLEQRLATQAAEGRALELKSQLYASIGIMAGSYAHNIKNLLVRPNDLLRRCLELDGLSGDQEHMLREVRLTLGTVTERLQQILRTVNRDPSRSEPSRLDLNQVVRGAQQTWGELAREKWKLALLIETAPAPLWIDADLSHLQQAIENLLFNARDATFEMRSRLREEAHRRTDLKGSERKNALIAAAGWRGSVLLRCHRQGEAAILEVKDNGVGMTAEVRQHCTETHFSTKRNNAVYEGNSTGMGLGLSFVTVILEHHRAALEIESVPLQGALFRLRFPLAEAPVSAPVTQDA